MVVVLVVRGGICVSVESCTSRTCCCCCIGISVTVGSGVCGASVVIIAVAIVATASAAATAIPSIAGTINVNKLGIVLGPIRPSISTVIGSETKATSASSTAILAILGISKTITLVHIHIHIHPLPPYLPVLPGCVAHRIAAFGPYTSACRIARGCFAFLAFVSYPPDAVRVICTPSNGV